MTKRVYYFGMEVNEFSFFMMLGMVVFVIVLFALVSGNVTPQQALTTVLVGFPVALLIAIIDAR